MSTKTQTDVLRRLERSLLLSPELKSAIQKSVGSLSEEQLIGLEKLLENEAPITMEMLREILRQSMAEKGQKFLREFDSDLAGMNRALNRESTSLEVEEEQTKAEHLFDDLPS